MYHIQINCNINTKNLQDVFEGKLIYAYTPKSINWILNSCLYYKNPNYSDLLEVSNLLPSDKNLDFRIGQDYQFYYPFGADKKVMIMGNSFIGNFIEFLPYSFKYTLGYFDNSRKLYFYRYEKDFYEYKPDVLIILLHTTNMFRLLNLYENEYSVNK